MVNKVSPKNHGGKNKRHQNDRRRFKSLVLIHTQAKSRLHLESTLLQLATRLRERSPPEGDASPGLVYSPPIESEWDSGVK